MHNWLKRLDIARTAFLIAIAIGIFLMGAVFAKKEIYPYQILSGHYKAAKGLIKQTMQVRPGLLEEKRYSGDGVTHHDQNLAYGGLTLVQGRFHDGVELRLIDMAGTVLHRWPADFFNIWPDPSHIIPSKNIPASDFNYHTQGMWAFPDGSVVFNFGELGTVKMDKCGNVKWTVDRMTHHSITPTSEGSFWIPAKGDVREVSDALLLPNTSRDKLLDSTGWYEDRLILVDADGYIRKEISVLEALFEGGYERELFDSSIISTFDPTHVNDIEIVTSTLASKINRVKAGDLLISIRQMHMLAILDQDTGRIKWHHIGPWVRQHDPDISSQGIIVVFNNGKEDLSLNRPPGSNLIALDPATGQERIVYPHSGQPSFYSEIMGTHQLLPNSNTLITESMAGRVFEIDAQGNLVWEYIKSYDDTHAALIESAIRYDKDYFVVQDWSCS